VNCSRSAILLAVIFFASSVNAFVILDDNTGGDCELKNIGVWIPETKTCTLTKDLNIGLNIGTEIGLQNITLNCSGHKIVGSGTGYGIHAYNPVNLTIENCDINGFNRGIYFWGGTGNNITANKIHSNILGIDVRLQYFIDISDNKIYSNTAHGIEVGYSSYSEVKNNQVYENGNIGIYLEVGKENEISGNEIFLNQKGVLLIFYPSSEGNMLFHNNIRQNQTGAYTTYAGLYSPTVGIYYNNFIDNNVQLWKGAAIRASLNNIGNYWSDYNGLDLDGDGVGDTDIPWQNVDSYPVMEENGWFRIPYCSNGVLDTGESDVDCGGFCRPCPDGNACLADSDCEWGYCNPNGICGIERDLSIEWVKPIQVVEDVPLVAGKDTVVRVKVVNNGPETETDVSLDYSGGCFKETKPKILIRGFSSKIVDFYPPNNCTK